VNWFSFYSLASYLQKRGFRCLDRFDLIDTKNIGALQKLVLNMTRAIPPLRLAGHVLTSGTVLFGLKVH
jgi:hypothetical protein